MRFGKRRMLRAGKLLRAGLALQRSAIPAWAPPVPRKQGRSARGRLIEPGRFVEHVYRNRAGSRRFKVYAPAAAHGGALPLVVMLHGCSQGPDDFARATRMNELAEELGFVVVYPAQSSRANGLKCWNWFEALHQQRNEGEPSLIAGITRRLLRHGLDPRRVYVAGLSAGGAMAAVVGGEYPDLYAAIGIHSGLPHRLARDPRVPIIAFHGDQDAIVHPGNCGFALAPGCRLATEHGKCNGRSFTRTRHFDARGRAMVEQWMVHAGGHAWFGGQPGSSFADPEGPDASREMLRFFLAQERGR